MPTAPAASRRSPAPRAPAGTPPPRRPSRARPPPPPPAPTAANISAGGIELSSGYPSDAVTAALAVASTGKPEPATSRAEATSHTLGEHEQLVGAVQLAQALGVGGEPVRPWPVLNHPGTAGEAQQPAPERHEQRHHQRRAARPEPGRHAAARPVSLRSCVIPRGGGLVVRGTSASSRSARALAAPRRAAAPRCRPRPPLPSAPLRRACRRLRRAGRLPARRRGRARGLRPGLRRAAAAATGSGARRNAMQRLGGDPHRRLRAASASRRRCRRGAGGARR